MNAKGSNQPPGKPEEINLLLPWYVNGTLSAEDKEKVERYLEQNPQMREEIALIKMEQEAAVEANREVSKAPAGALDSILAKIDESENPPTEEKPIADILEFVRETLSSLFHPPVVQYAAAAAIIVMIVQAGAIVSLMKSEGPGEDISGRTTVGDPGTLPKGFLKNLSGVVLKGQRFVIGYAPSATISDIQQQLSRYRGVIVDGPRVLESGVSPIVLTVAFPEDMPSNQVTRWLQDDQEKGLIETFRKVDKSAKP